MKKLLIIIFPIILIACKKETSITSNTNTAVKNYYFYTINDAPDVYKSMFLYLPQKKDSILKLKIHSNTGLTETMLVSNNNKVLGNKFVTQFSGTNTFDTVITYSMLNFQYKSSIYGFNFQIVAGYLWSIEYCFSHKNLPGFGYLTTWNIDSSYWGIGVPNFMIRFIADSAKSSRLNFPYYNNVSRSLNSFDNCFTEISDLKIGNKIFQNVSKFKNEYAFQNNKLTTPYYIWIDKKYGVISFQMLDSTIWNFDF